jgi:hypothetical protein
MVQKRFRSISRVIPDGREATDRESRLTSAGARPLWIPGQTFGLPGMTSNAPERDAPAMPVKAPSMA